MNKYIYVWKEQGVAGSGLPFYIGQGTHQENARYPRAYTIHLDCNQTGRISYAQKKANKLARLGSPHVVEILHDNLTQVEADALEKTLIARLGRKHIGTGILYNLSAGGDINPMRDPIVKARHAEVMSSDEYRAKARIWMQGVFSEEYKKAKSIETTERLNDPIKKAEWYAKFNTPEVHEKMRAKQAEICGHKVEYNGVEYRSKKELARALGISSQCLKYRMENNIALDKDTRSTKKGLKV